MRPLSGLLDDPRHGRAAALILLGALAALTLVLQLALDIDGALDTDTMNFGLAAFRFDVTDHQPQPPGYPGYVLFLKVIHVLFPGLGPLEVAKWGSRLCGVGTVCAAYWAGGRALSDEDAPGRGRPLLCALVATFHPVLWYYGADGQSHAAEALLTLIVFGASLRVKARPDLRSRLLLVVLFGLAGAVRPTIPLLSSPLLVWVFWGRPLRDWAAAIGTGLVTCALWYVPLILVSGGWDLYSRTQRALLVNLFFANYSIFATTAARLALFNATATLQYALLCLFPLVAWGGRRPPWRRAYASVIVTNVAFYALVYVAEAGYLSAVAALACLVPATFGLPARLHTRLRLAAAVVAGFLFFTLAPGSMPVLGTPVSAVLPTLRHTGEVEATEHYYRDRACGAAGGEPALVVTDNPNTTHTRLLPLYCPNVLIGILLRDFFLNPDLEAWLVFDESSLFTLPTDVPLEPGPPASGELPRRVQWVIVAPDGSEDLRREIAEQARCAPSFGEVTVPSAEDERLPDVLVFPAGCLPKLRLGRNELRIPER